MNTLQVAMFLKLVVTAVILLESCGDSIEQNNITDDVFIVSSLSPYNATISASTASQELLEMVKEMNERLKRIENITEVLALSRDEEQRCRGKEDTNGNFHEVKHERTKIMMEGMTNIEEMLHTNNSSSVLHLHRMLAPQSCYYWKMMGFTDSGRYMIDPDGRAIGRPPITVYCDMSSGSTLIHHDLEKEEEAPTCRGPGCSSRNIQYSANYQQMLKLIDISYQCRQSVKIDCLESPFEQDDIMYSWWEDRDGNPQRYWAGSNAGSHLCSCGLSNGCVDPRFKCNCDTGARQAWLADEGFVSNSTALPITRFYFGSKEDSKGLQLRYSLGPLECFGRKELPYPKSCTDIWNSGSYHSGYYYIGDPGSISLVYCTMVDFNSQVNQITQTGPFGPSSEDVIEKLSGISRAIENISKTLGHHDDLFEQLTVTLNQNKKVQVMFNAFQTDNVELKHNAVSFDRVTINVGDGFNKGTNSFKTPVAGIYVFAFHAEIFESNAVVRVHIRKNGANVATAASDDTYWSTVGTTVLLDLEVGDTVDVFGTSGVLDGDADGRLLFTGFLMN